MTFAAQPPTTGTGLSDLHHLLHPAQGEQCWRASFSYARELRVHLGAPVPESGTKRPRGRWLLRTHATPWQLCRNDSVILKSTYRSQQKLDQIKSLQGQTLVEIRPTHDYGVEMLFTGDLRLVIKPRNDLVRPTPSELPYWELLTPYRTVILAGPGKRWQTYRSDQPIATIEPTLRRDVSHVHRSVNNIAPSGADVSSLVDELLTEGRRLERIANRRQTRPVNSRLPYLEAKWRRLRSRGRVAASQ